MAKDRIFKRKIYEQLLKWKQTSKGSSALLVQGARRIGKSTIVEEFARKEYESYILIDFTKCPREVRDLFNDVSDLNVEIVVNNAGFGAVGRFDSIELEKQLDMIDVNCTALTTLTYMFLKDFRYRDCGAILNVASSAGLLPGGPNMAVYYATKSYVVALTNAVYDELKASYSSVKISALCPGPVDTEFNDVAGAKFSLKGISPKYCAMCAAYGLDRGERLIIPEKSIKLFRTMSKLAPERVSLRVISHQQKKKSGDLGG